MAIKVDVDKTRTEIRRQMTLWGIDPSEYEIIWQEERRSTWIDRLPGATLRYMRNGKWQSISCFGYPSRGENLRQVFFLVERLRIAEQHGVQYSGLEFSKELTVTGNPESQRQEKLLDAYDMLGVRPDDPVEMIKKSYTLKATFYHPDKGGTDDKFKRLTEAFEAIMASRGERG